MSANSVAARLVNLLSSRGYGLLWNSPAIGRAELAANGTRWVADSARQEPEVLRIMQNCPPSCPQCEEYPISGRVFV
jgi:hypothetical protein